MHSTHQQIDLNWRLRIVSHSIEDVMAYIQHTYVFCEEDENGVAHVFDGRRLQTPSV